MFFFLSKILAFLLTPLVWIAGLLLYTLLARNAVRRKRAFRAAVIILFFFTNSFIQSEFMRMWEMDEISETEIEQHDIGIVLGGFLSYDKSIDRINFYSATDRILHAVDLYHKKKIKKILITSGSGTIVDYGYKEADIVKDFLLRIKIPERDIIIENQSKNTRENAINTAKIIEAEYPGSSLLLITSAFHMRRSVGCFEKAGLEVKPYPVDKYIGPRKFHFDYLVIPNVSALEGWTLLIHEVSGYLIYKIRGYA